MLSMLRGLLVFVLLIGVIVGSFWISFELGKRVLGSAGNPPAKIIPVKIPEVPPEIAGLQESVSTATTLKKVAAAAHEKQVKPTRNQYYKVQAGVFKDKAGAEDLASMLKEEGIDHFIRKTAAGWRVQVGAYKTRAQAEARRTALKQKGYNPSIIIE
ncbi:MAG: SPOR domain-containing protein [Candidatus Margulisbacteria bacterium]|nr:SPOR domain-containing protein [Candidatus Margulisiibacteriota bacterium]